MEENLRHRFGTGDAAHHAHRSYGAAAQLSTTVPQCSASRLDRCRRRPDAVRKAAWLVAILDILALLGMITKNAVILIGQIDAERGQGKGVWEAAIDANSSRFRPIMLTALSTVLGMIPIAPTVLWGPMAFAIMGGLLVATIFYADFPADTVRRLVQGKGRLSY